jgi:hypothetical protein
VVVDCFCGCVYPVEGDLGSCPRCGEYVAFNRVTPRERDQMLRELELIIGLGEEAAAHAPNARDYTIAPRAIRTDRSAAQTDPGLREVGWRSPADRLEP